MLIAGYCFGISSDGGLREEVHLNLGLSLVVFRRA
jgi:hypothetical protein